MFKSVLNHLSLNVLQGKDDDEIVELIAYLNMHEFGIEEMNDGLRNVSRQSLPAFAGQWMRSFVAYDPREDWKKCSAPVLAMNGG